MCPDTKVLIIVGTRPEAIKMAPVVRQLRRSSERFEVRVCATAQHRHMLDQALDLFGIVPDIDLDVMQSGQSPAQVAARVLSRLEPVLQAERPDWVLVQGDTTTAMAAAIAAHYLRLRVGHVEAGLRSGDRTNPFPEESNRFIADHLSYLLFAPTWRASLNLQREGIPAARIQVTGNTVVDALLEVAAWPCPPGISDLLQPGLKLVLVTAHRRESFGAPLRDICRALQALVARRGDVQVVYPVHPNPNVCEPVHELLEGQARIRLLPPLDYLNLVHLMKHSFLILTDSGGIQEEAPSLGVPVLVLRAVTERPEAVEAGAARLVGTCAPRILAEVGRLLDDPAARAAMAGVPNPYGDGHAAQRIVKALLACEEIVH